MRMLHALSQHTGRCSTYISVGLQGMSKRGGAPVDLALLSHLTRWRLQMMMQQNRHHHHDGLQNTMPAFSQPSSHPQVLSSSHSGLTKLHNSMRGYYPPVSALDFIKTHASDCNRKQYRRHTYVHHSIRNRHRLRTPRKRKKLRSHLHAEATIEPCAYEAENPHVNR